MSLKVLLAFEVKLFYKEFGMYFSENFVLQHCIIQDYFIINELQTHKGIYQIGYCLVFLLLAYIKKRRKQILFLLHS